VSGSTQCPHSDLDFDIHVTGMVDSNVSHLRLRARCKICNKRMRLSRGLNMGCSSKFPTRDSEEGGLGVMLPMLAEDEEPSKEYGFGMVMREVIG
jgi:hypothetical protein